MSRENGEEDDDIPGVKVHEIRFDEFGIMEDGLDDSTHQKLNSVEPEGINSLLYEITQKLFYILTLFRNTGYWRKVSKFAIVYTKTQSCFSVFHFVLLYFFP